MVVALTLGTTCHLCVDRKRDDVWQCGKDVAPCRFLHSSLTSPVFTALPSSLHHPHHQTLQIAMHHITLRPLACHAVYWPYLCSCRVRMPHFTLSFIVAVHHCSPADVFPSSNRSHKGTNSCSLSGLFNETPTTRYLSEHAGELCSARCTIADLACCR